GHLVEHGGWEDLGAEDGPHVVDPDLGDEVLDLPGAGLGEVAGLRRPDHGDPVAAGEVGEAVVVGQQLLLLPGYGVDGLGDGPVQLVEHGGEAGLVVAVVGRVGRVAPGHGVAPG